MNKDTNIILVTGATGNQGGAIARRLLSQGFRVRAMTRNPDSDKARFLTRLGAQVVQGDFDEPQSLERALEGVWGAYSVQNSWEAGVEKEEEQGKLFAELARGKGIGHFVYSSVGSAQRGTGIPHFDNKWRIEQKIRELAFPSYTILRPAFFMDNFLSPWFKPAIMEGKLSLALQPETVLQMIAVEDIGRFGALAFESHEKLNGVELDIAGDRRTMPDVAEIISHAMDKRVVFDQRPIEEVRSWSEDFATMLQWFDRVGYCADINGLERNYGFSLLKFPEWAAKAPWR
jgi:uncharacterized protein YbjT (DUF2867 family)